MHLMSVVASVSASAKCRHFHLFVYWSIERKLHIYIFIYIDLHLGSIVASVSALAHLPTLQNLGPFEVVGGYPTSRHSHTFWLGIGGFRL